MSEQDAAATRSVVEMLLKRLGEGDIGGVAELYADKVDWSLSWPEGPQSDAVPWIRNRTTRSDVQQHFATIAEYNCPSGQGTSVSEIVVSGADVFITGIIRNESVQTRRHYAARFALHLRVIDDLVVQHHVYEDSLAVYSTCAG